MAGVQECSAFDPNERAKAGGLFLMQGESGAWRSQTPLSISNQRLYQKVSQDTKDSGSAPPSVLCESGCVEPRCVKSCLDANTRLAGNEMCYIPKKAETSILASSSPHLQALISNPLRLLDVEISALCDLYQQQLAELGAEHSLLLDDQAKLAALIAPYLDEQGHVAGEFDESTLLFKQGLDLRLLEYEEDCRRIQQTERQLQRKIDDVLLNYESLLLEAQGFAESRLLGQVKNLRKVIWLLQNELDEMRFQRDIYADETKRLRGICRFGNWIEDGYGISEPSSENSFQVSRMGKRDQGPLRVAVRWPHRPPPYPPCYEVKTRRLLQRHQQKGNLAEKLVNATALSRVKTKVGDTTLKRRELEQKKPKGLEEARAKTKPSLYQEDFTKFSDASDATGKEIGKNSILRQSPKFDIEEENGRQYASVKNTGEMKMNKSLEADLMKQKLPPLSEKHTRNVSVKSKAEQIPQSWQHAGDYSISGRRKSEGHLSVIMNTSNFDIGKKSKCNAMLVPARHGECHTSTFKGTALGKLVDQLQIQANEAKEKAETFGDRRVSQARRAVEISEVDTGKNGRVNDSSVVCGGSVSDRQLPTEDGRRSDVNASRSYQASSFSAFTNREEGKRQESSSVQSTLETPEIVSVSVDPSHFFDLHHVSNPLPSDSRENCSHVIGSWGQHGAKKPSYKIVGTKACRSPCSYFEPVDFSSFRRVGRCQLPLSPYSSGEHYTPHSKDYSSHNSEEPPIYDRQHSAACPLLSSLGTIARHQSTVGEIASETDFHGGIQDLLLPAWRRVGSQLSDRSMYSAPDHMNQGRAYNVRSIGQAPSVQGGVVRDAPSTNEKSVKKSTLYGMKTSQGTHWINTPKRLKKASDKQEQLQQTRASTQNIFSAATSRSGSLQLAVRTVPSPVASARGRPRDTLSLTSMSGSGEIAPR